MLGKFVTSTKVHVTPEDGTDGQTNEADGRKKLQTSKKSWCNLFLPKSIFNLRKCSPRVYWLGWPLAFRQLRAFSTSHLDFLLHVSSAGNLHNTFGLVVARARMGGNALEDVVDISYKGVTI